MKQAFKFPNRILKNIKAYLEREKRETEEKIKRVESEDPFADTDRLSDNASSDTDVKEQYGHARVTALKRELERTLVKIRKALTRIGVGKYGFCTRCGKMIDTDRLSVMPAADLCIDCANGGNSKENNKKNNKKENTSKK